MFKCMVIPDTQYLAKDHPNLFMQMAKSVLAFHEQEGLDAVIHLGDLVDGGGLDRRQYEVAKHSLSLIDEAKIPLIIAAGNHDYDTPIGIGLKQPHPERDGRNLIVYNKYFGIDRLKGKPWYQGSYLEQQIENSYYLVNGVLCIVLEFGPRDEVLQWANRILKEHASMPCIVITHSYMYIDGSRTSSHSMHNPLDSEETIDGNDGQMIWDKFVAHHANIVGVFSGHHVSGNISVRIDESPFGNHIVQSFQNWQEAADGGAGRMRFVQYDEQEGTIQSKVYHPLLQTFEDEVGYAFSYDSVWKKNVGQPLS